MIHMSKMILVTKSAINEHFYIVAFPQSVSIVCLHY